ncbi:MAG: hypothetical protein II007_07330 [Gammaproteobacteria bacterium]|nr:hypothetical protein [Gammaproteobacteria bacterium]
MPAEQAPIDAPSVDGGQTAVGQEQPAGETESAAPNDSSSTTGGQVVAEEQSPSTTGPSMPGEGSDPVIAVPDDAASSVVDIDTPLQVVDDPGTSAAGELPTGDFGPVPGAPASDNLDELFGDETAGSRRDEEEVVDLEEPLVIGGDPISDPEPELIAENPTTPTPGDLDGLFGDGTESAGIDQDQNHSSSRELRWELPSQRVDGSQLSRQEVKAIELWGGRSEQQLQRWATLPPASQSFSLAETANGLYHFTLVTVDQDGLRSDPSAPVIRDLR